MNREQMKALDFTYNSRAKWYEMELQDFSCMLIADKGTTEECTVAYETYLKYENSIEDLDFKCRDYVSVNMLESANDWLEGEFPIDEELFAARIRLETLVFENNGTITAYYDDDDIFAGHSIVVGIDVQGQIIDADIAG